MTNITVSELKLRLNQEVTLNLLDVREADERAEFNIGGTFCPVKFLLYKPMILKTGKPEVICYCRSGNRSIQAAMMLESLGFSNVKTCRAACKAGRKMKESDLNVILLPHYLKHRLK
jgi:rhodanese-related sulfurtransferase